MDHSLSPGISTELRGILVASTHRVARTRDLAMKYLNRLINAFPSLMCDAPLVFAILDVLTLLRKACEGEFTDEVSLGYAPESSLLLMTLSVLPVYTPIGVRIGENRHQA